MTGRGWRRAVARLACALAALTLLAACRVEQAARAPAAGGPAPAVVTLPTDSVGAMGRDGAGPAGTAARRGAEPATVAPGVATVAPARPAREPGPPPDPARLRLALETVVTGLDKPVDVKPAGPGGRLAVVEKPGRVRLVTAAGLAVAPFLDIRSRVGSGGTEQGLLGIAFHPHYGLVPGERRFFVHYTDRGGDTVVAEYRGTEDPGRADPASARVLLTAEQPAVNHNGGQLAFGPDGYLYIGLGDGGGAGDRYGNARDPGTWLGKILRVDVNAAEPYGVPETNPFLGVPGWRPEVWAWGLRNPWKFSFDRVSGDLYIADVGQGDWEELSFQPAGSVGGQDYGWPLLEGNHCYDSAGNDCDLAGATVRPAVEYAHDEGNCSVTGGYVYRGRALPGLVGAYLFGDYCSGRLWAAWRDGGAAWRTAELADTAAAISSFGEGQDGELYVADYAGGLLQRVAAAPGPANQTPPAKRPVMPPSPRTE